jgi:ADP-heptose:LPS heptosyltransferase
VRKLEKFLSDILLNLLRLSVIRQNIASGKIDHTGIKNILVIIRHQMGDMLLASPMLRSLKVRYPDAKITLVAKSSARFTEIFKDASFVDEVKEYESGFENFVHLIKDLRDKNIDLAVVPSTVVFSVTNHLIAYYSNAKIRTGAASINTLDNKADFLLNLKKDFLWESRKVHYIERNLDIIRQLGFEPQEKRIRIELKNENTEFAHKYFSENFPDSSRPVMGFHPGAAKPGNVWASGNFAELILRLSEKFNAYIYISEGPDDTGYVSKLAGILNKFVESGTFNSDSAVLKNDIPVIGRLSLANCAAVIDRLSLFVTNDTGIMHLASGTDTPVIALFGPTKAGLWGPIGDNKVSIQSASSDINNISVDKVFDVCGKVFMDKVKRK